MNTQRCWEDPRTLALNVSDASATAPQRRGPSSVRLRPQDSEPGWSGDLRRAGRALSGRTAGLRGDDGQAMTGARIQLFDVRAQEDEAFLAAWDGRRPGTPGCTARCAATSQPASSRSGPAQSGGATTSCTRTASPRRGRREVHQPVRGAAGRGRAVPGRLERARDALAARPGYLGTRLHPQPRADRLPVREHRALVEPAHVRPGAKEPEVQEAAAAVEFRSHPALYEVVRG